MPSDGGMTGTLEGSPQSSIIPRCFDEMVDMVWLLVEQIITALDAVCAA